MQQVQAFRMPIAGSQRNVYMIRGSGLGCSVLSAIAQAGASAKKAVVPAAQHGLLSIANNLMGLTALAPATGNHPHSGQPELPNPVLQEAKSAVAKQAEKLVAKYGRKNAGGKTKNAGALLPSATAIVQQKAAQILNRIHSHRIKEIRKGR